MSSAASDPNATDDEKEIEMFKIRKLIKNLEAARRCVHQQPCLLESLGFRTCIGPSRCQSPASTASSFFF